MGLISEGKAAWSSLDVYYSTACISQHLALKNRVGAYHLEKNFDLDFIDWEELWSS